MFDKSRETFPIKSRYIFLSHCGVSPLYKGAFERIVEVSERQHLEAHLVFSEYEAALEGLREAGAVLLKTSPDNLAFVKNTSEGINMIANGYPFEPGDQILSFVHEYPANHYPWRLQSRRGVELVLMPDVDPTGLAPDGSPSAWAMDDLEALAGPKTRVVAISHPQFTSGFAADLPALAAFCAERGIDLVVDAAQSVGARPLYPEELGIGAVVCSGWKWLMGPVGTGLMYTSPTFRAKLRHTMGGAELVRQGHRGFLNHTFDPHPTAKRFEYSTSPIALAAGLLASVKELPLRYGVEAIEAEIHRLHALFLELIDRDRYTPLEFAAPHRSAILSLVCRDDPVAVAEQVMETGNVMMTVRGGYLRFAPHFATTDEEVERAADVLNRVGW